MGRGRQWPDQVVGKSCGRGCKGPVGMVWFGLVWFGLVGGKRGLLLDGSFGGNC